MGPRRSGLDCQVADEVGQQLLGVGHVGIPEELGCISSGVVLTGSYKHKVLCELTNKGLDSVQYCLFFPYIKSWVLGMSTAWVKQSLVMRAGWRANRVDPGFASGCMQTYD